MAFGRRACCVCIKITNRPGIMPTQVGSAPNYGTAVLHLIKMWLVCPVEETDDRGRKTRTTEVRDKRRGIPGYGRNSCRSRGSWGCLAFYSVMH